MPCRPPRPNRLAMHTGIAPILLWFRRDLRLADQAAVSAAAASGAPVIAVYVLDDESPRHRRMGAASRWWLHHSLESLSQDLATRGSRLVRCCLLKKAAAAAATALLPAEALGSVNSWAGSFLAAKPAGSSGQASAAHLATVS